ncbi:uncharacterized protein LOC120349583 [Nilaparvata lugens]|uniref:uncharacterized protein LOC120349583 n=1 Tax=Nilaparvata lugens TaxID=108931 RepID=UPI00193DFDBB|nr:uncharacterized protein LOC120349583 [Nilaparvata lugens]
MIALEVRYAENQAVFARLGSKPYTPAVIEACPLEGFLRRQLTRKNVTRITYRIRWADGRASWLGETRLVPRSRDDAPPVARQKLRDFVMRLKKRLKDAHKKWSSSLAPCRVKWRLDLQTAALLAIWME